MPTSSRSDLGSAESNVDGMDAIVNLKVRLILRYGLIE